MNQNWLERIKSAEITCLLQDGKKKVHYKFPTGEEMAEEYNIETGVVMRRAWKYDQGLKRTGKWMVEIGDPEPDVNSVTESVGIKEDPNTPYIIKRVTKQNLEWRIRNLPYPLPTYSVTADQDKMSLIVRTENKKYYKIIPLIDLERANVKPDQTAISLAHKYNTLIITYKKPPEVIKMDKEIMTEIEKAKVIDEGEIPSCNPS